MNKKYLFLINLILLCSIFAVIIFPGKLIILYGYEIENLDDEYEEEKTDDETEEDIEGNHEDTDENPDDERTEEDIEENLEDEGTEEDIEENLEDGEEEEDNENDEQDEEEYGKDEEEHEIDDEEEYIGIDFELLEVDMELLMPEVDTRISITPRTGSLGDWTDYNGLIFGEAYIYESVSGGGLAVKNYLEVNNDFTAGANYSSRYDAALNIGEYTNDYGRPAFLYGGNDINIGNNVKNLDVYGGAIVMNEEMAEKNADREVGFRPQTDSAYETKNETEINNWFDTQQEIVKKTSKLFIKANDTEISIDALSDGSYRDEGADYYKNQYLTYNDEVFENALFITVRTETEVNFGQWWPVYSIINFDVNWALDYELLVFNFPDAVNVTMNSSSFNIENLSHWSTTVDAWIGEQGMTERLALAEKVVYNFPRARSVEANQALIQGSILAPDAAFIGIGVGNAGHIYGHIVAKDFYAQGNFTIHPFSLSHWAFDITEDAIDKEIKTGNIAFRQYLYLNGQPTSIRLEGGEFYLINHKDEFYKGEGKFTENINEAELFTPQAYGNTVIENIPIGTYILTNVKAPEGFVLNENNSDNLYTYAEYPVSLSRADETASVIRYSEPEITDIYFKVVDSQSGEGLSGAVFTIVREADEYEGTTVGANYTSSDEGLFISKNLTMGTYDLLESMPPAGYDLIPEGKFRFWIQWDEEEEQLRVADVQGHVFAGTKEEPVLIEHYEGSEQNTLILIKYANNRNSADAPYTLPGAFFDLYRFEEEENYWMPVKNNSDGEDIEIITNDLGYSLIQNIENGVYRLAEIKAPYGYGLKNQYFDEALQMEYAYEFVFQEELSHLTAYIPDTPLTADIVLKSLGITKDGSKMTAEGISYKLEHRLADSPLWEEVFYSQNTNYDGELKLKDLEKGEYRLTQIKLPLGYKSIEPSVIYFNISFNEENQTEISVFYNDETIGSESYPVSAEAEEQSITVRNEIETRNLLVYKIDNDYILEETAKERVHYTVDYLEGAVFRLQRRINTRASWKDYGESFTSEYLYTEDGSPVLDQYGNHMAAAVFEGGLFYGDYQLVEIEPPRGYHTNSSIKVTLNDGTEGYQMHLFTITSEMIIGGGESRFIIEDYKKTIDFSFLLTDTSDFSEKISGAVFSLYYFNGNLEFDEDLIIGNSTTNENGQGSFKNLTSGRYMMKQTQSGEGYMLPGFYWYMEIDQYAEEIKVWKVLQEDLIPFLPDEDGNFMITAEKNYMLPMTGGPGIRLFYLLGGGIFGLGLLKIYIIRRGKNEKE